MPDYVIRRIIKALSEQGKALKGAKILVLGVAYKKDIDDMRESPALTLIEMLIKEGAEVSYHDPHIPRIGGLRSHTLEMDSVELDMDKLGEYDLVLIAADHNVFPYNEIWDRAKLIVDTRGVYQDRDEGEGFIRA